MEHAEFLGTVFDLQETLQTTILRNNPEKPGEDRQGGMFVALLQEVGEMLQEWQGFKFWKQNPQPRTKENIVCTTCDGSGDENWPSSLERLIEGGSANEYLKCEDCNGTGSLGDRNPLLEETADVLHMFADVAIYRGYRPDHFYYDRMILVQMSSELFGIRVDGKAEEVNDGILNLYYMIAFAGKHDTREYKPRESEEHFRAAFLGFLGLAKYVFGFNDEQLLQAYRDKHLINMRRQKNGY